MITARPLPWFGEEIMMAEMPASQFVPTKILVPLDFSSSSFAALEAATDLARHFHSEIFLLHVIPMLPDISEFAYPSGPLTLEEIHNESTNDAEENLAQRIAILVSNGVKASFKVEVGNDVAGNIMEVIEREHIELLVISTHGMSGWRPLVFGSIAEKVVKRAECPLLLFRALKPVDDPETSESKVPETMAVQ
jgi:nucleotide-binding universal stress UspA family protein